MTTREATTVAIVGGGVSGLTTALLLRRCGVECVVLERQSRSYVEQRQRAGVVEYRGVRMFKEWGLDELLGRFPADNGLEIRVEGQTRLFGKDEHSQRFTGQAVPQQALVRSMMVRLLAEGGDLRFDAADVELHGLRTGRPVVSYTGADGERREIECDFVAGCDGDHGVSNTSVPDGALAIYTFDYGLAWLTILADAPPPSLPLMAVGERGYAAHFARGPRSSRFYLQCAPEDSLDDWPADRIWEQLRSRLYQPGLPTGPITSTELFPLRGLVREPMSYGRLFLLGDAAHVIPPMGAKGMNLALYDAETFAKAIRDFTRNSDETGLRSYSGDCLARNWRYQEFAEWLSQMLLDMCGPDADPFRARLSRARFERVLGSPAGALYYSEMMTGLG